MILSVDILMETENLFLMMFLHIFSRKLKKTLVCRSCIYRKTYAWGDFYLIGFSLHLRIPGAKMERGEDLVFVVHS